MHWKKEQGQLFFFILVAHQIYIVQQVLESQKQVRMAILVSHYCSPSLGQLFYVFIGSPKIGLCKLVIFRSIGSTTKNGCSLYFGSPKIELCKVCHSLMHWMKEQGQLFFFISLAHQIYIVQEVLESQKEVRMAVDP